MLSFAVEKERKSKGRSWQNQRKDAKVVTKQVLECLARRPSTHTHTHTHTFCIILLSSSLFISILKFDCPLSIKSRNIQPVVSVHAGWWAQLTCLKPGVPVFSVSNVQHECIYTKGDVIKNIQAQDYRYTIHYQHCEPCVRSHLPSDLHKICRCHLEQGRVDIEQASFEYWW